MDDIGNSGAQILVSADLGCLMNIAGFAARQSNTALDVRHIAEVLANQLDAPSMTVDAVIATGR